MQTEPKKEKNEMAQEFSDEPKHKNEQTADPAHMKRVLEYISHQVRENPMVYQAFPMTARRMRGILSFIQIFSVAWEKEKMYDGGHNDPLLAYAQYEIVDFRRVDMGDWRRPLSLLERTIILDVLSAFRNVCTDGVYDKIEELTADREPLYDHDIEYLRAYASSTQLQYKHESGNKDDTLQIVVLLPYEKREPAETRMVWREKQEEENQ